MNKLDYNIQLAKIILKHEEIKRARRRRYMKKIIGPAWYVGMVSAYIHSFARFMGIPYLRAIAFILYMISFIVYLEVWRYPATKSIPEILKQFQADHSVVRGVILFIAIPGFNLLHLIVFMIIAHSTG